MLMKSKDPIVVFTAFHPQHQQLLWNESAQVAARRCGFQIRMLPPQGSDPDPDIWAELFRGADVIFTSWHAPRLDEKILRYAPDLCFVGHAAGSVASIVSPYLFERNIPICTANQTMSQAVARWCLMMTLIGLYKLPIQAQWGDSVSLDWGRRCSSRDPERVVYGIWGFGDISRNLVCSLQSIGARDIRVCSGSLTEANAVRQGLTKVGLETLFAESDVIYPLQSLNDATHGMIGRTYLDLIQDGALLINAGRAHLINEEDFVQSLKENRYKAMVDVHYEEPRRTDSLFTDLPNLIATPHVAGTIDPVPYLRVMIEEYARFRRGEPLLYQVKAERALSMTREVIASRP